MSVDPVKVLAVANSLGMPLDIVADALDWPGRVATTDAEANDHMTDLWNKGANRLTWWQASDNSVARFW